MTISRSRTTKSIIDIDMSVEFSCHTNMYIKHSGGMTAQTTVMYDKQISKYLFVRSLRVFDRVSCLHRSQLNKK